MQLAVGIMRMQPRQRVMQVKLAGMPLQQDLEPTQRRATVDQMPYPQAIPVIQLQMVMQVMQ